MDINLGSVGNALGTNGVLDLGGKLLGNVNNLVKAVGYFVGGDFQEALAKGFMA